MLDQFEKNRFLRDLTTFGIGGTAQYFLEVHSIAAMQAVIRFCYQTHLPYFILGKGSNVLFDDKGYQGLVIANRIHFLNKLEETRWQVGAGYSFSLLGSQTARQGLSGLEFASGIPGSVGGAIFMNAGANGNETASTLVEVEFIDETGNLLILSKQELNFSYRFSIFQQRKGAIVSATFQLYQNDEARQKQLSIIQYRKQTQPYKDKSAGCIFRNPQPNHAGVLIEQAGLKGKTIGQAQVSSMHANFVVNTGSASSKDVQSLIEYICQEVKDKTGVHLESELRFIPYQKD